MNRCNGRPKGKKPASTPTKSRFDNPMTPELVELQVNIEKFLLLARLGFHDKAWELADNAFAPHIHKLPVFLAYLDMLLMPDAPNEPARRNIELLLGAVTPHNVTETAGVSKNRLNDLFALIDELKERALNRPPKSPNLLIDTWEAMKKWYFHRPGDDLDRVQITTIEMYLRNLVLVSDNVGDKHANLPWTPRGKPRWTSFCDWCNTLRQKGYYWEALNIQRTLLPVLDVETAKKFLLTPYGSFTLTREVRGDSFNEYQALAELATSNSICSFLGTRLPNLLNVIEMNLRVSQHLKKRLCQGSQIDDIREGKPLRRISDIEQGVKKLRAKQGLGPAEHLRKQIFRTCLPREGDSIDKPDSDGRTPLSHAAERGQLEVVTLLLKSGADAASEDDRGRTPISYASENGHIEVLSILINQEGCKG